ncbi:hypothetical protein [Hydrogenophaga sp.]|uniref:hypothetical protein n=1 Tax=Hydrogenophaga sp. TaxID=1904254 RepID=UPI0025BFA6FD|nr:hypothetical protein [Hydrogenophaga sp.]
MDKIEQLARGQLSSDPKDLVKNDRWIFGWDVPEVEEASSDRMILNAQRQALDDVESECSAGIPGCISASRRGQRQVDRGAWIRVLKGMCASRCSAPGSDHGAAIVTAHARGKPP